MQFVQREAELPHVNVYQITLETPMLPADLSVSSMLIVLLPSSAEIFTVLIPVQVSVAPMLTVRWQIMCLCVSVTKVILGIHLLHAEDPLLQWSQLRLWIPATLIHVDPTVSLPEQLVRDASATVYQR